MSDTSFVGSVLGSDRLGETLDERADAAAEKCGDRDAKDDDR